MPADPEYSVTTVAVFEGDGRIVAVSMRNYLLTAGGQAELDAPTGTYPLDEQQLVELAAEKVWAQLAVG